MAGEGAGRSAGEIRGGGGSGGKGAARGVFLRKEEGTAPLPTLPPAPRISSALFPAPSPAILWVCPFLYSAAGQPGCNCTLTQRAANGGSDPSCLNLAFLGRPDFPSKGSKTL